MELPGHGDAKGLDRHSQIKVSFSMNQALPTNPYRNNQCDPGSSLEKVLEGYFRLWVQYGGTEGRCGARLPADPPSCPFHTGD